MPEYEFFVSGDAPKPANKAMRSHAIKSALALRSRKLKELAGQPEVIPGSQSSRQTQEQKDTLKGRFRLCNRPEDMEKSTRKYSSKRLMPSQLKLSRSPSPVVQNPSPADSQLVSQSLDPFDVLPVENNWRVQRLIQYCRAISMCYFNVRVSADRTFKSSQSSPLTKPKTPNRDPTSAWPCLIRLS